MASKAVVDAIMAQLGDQWSSVDGAVLPVYKGNDGASGPANGLSFLSVKFPVSNGFVAGMGGAGSRTVREEGGFSIVVSTPIGNGLDRALGWCDELIALFLTRNIGGSLTTYVPSPPAESVNDSASYYVLRIACPYYYDRVA